MEGKRRRRVSGRPKDVGTKRPAMEMKKSFPPTNVSTIMQERGFASLCTLATISGLMQISRLTLHDSPVVCIHK